MTTAQCRPITAPLSLAMRESSADPLADFLGDVADLSCALQRKRCQLAALDSSDARVVRASRRLEELEAQLHELGVEAASVHQELVHQRLA
jgi:hypothetical protein